MAKINRKVAKIFGSDAGLNQISKFGSLAAGSPVFTTDPDVIQQLANYLEGWYSGVVGSNSPAIEDMNALCYLYAYQIAYTMQTGVPEWNSGTTYYIGSLVTEVGTGKIYRSKTNDNLNNALTDNTNWGRLLLDGLAFTNLLTQSLSVPSGETLLWPNLIIDTGDTVTVDSGGFLEGMNAITVNGTLTVNGTVHVA